MILNVSDDVTMVIITMNVAKSLLLVGALALIPTVSHGAEEHLIKPSPCDVRKVMKVTKGEDGKEILTHTISADCGYDSNFLKKHKELKEQIKKELAELNIRLKKQEDLPQRTHIVIREIPKPVDLTKQYGDNKTIEWSWLEFFIGMLEGLRKET